MSCDALAVITDNVEQRRKVPGDVMTTEEEDNVDDISGVVEEEDDNGNIDVGL